MRHMSDADYSVWYEYGVTCDGFVFSFTGWRGHDRRQLTANRRIATELGRSQSGVGLILRRRV